METPRFQDGGSLPLTRASLTKMDKVRSTSRRVLTRAQFLEGLRLEKRRADRSKAPLSIILFRLDRSESEGNGGSEEELLMSISRKVRETDIKGWLTPETFGLLLPDTDSEGARSCAGKIVNGHPDCSATLGTYPDLIFQNLLTQTDAAPDLFPIDLRESEAGDRRTPSAKRLIDIIGALAGLVVSSPLLFLTAVAVKASSPGPILFTQVRLGLKGRRFPFYKFRSMYWNSDDRIHREYVSDLIQGNLDKVNQGDEAMPMFKLKADSRITRVGRLIRKLSIDELPQFVNVLKGEMSLVGPRPPLPYEVEKYESWHLRRILEVKPGLTGIWQVEGRSKTSFNDMVRMDLRYVRDQSTWLDFKLLIKTFKAVIRPNGAV